MSQIVIPNKYICFYLLILVQLCQTRFKACGLLLDDNHQLVQLPNELLRVVRDPGIAAYSRSEVNLQLLNGNANLGLLNGDVANHLLPCTQLVPKWALLVLRGVECSRALLDPSMDIFHLLLALLPLLSCLLKQSILEQKKTHNIVT